MQVMLVLTLDKHFTHLSVECLMKKRNPDKLEIFKGPGLFSVPPEYKCLKTCGTAGVTYNFRVFLPQKTRKLPLRPCLLQAASPPLISLPHPARKKILSCNRSQGVISTLPNVILVPGWRQPFLKRSEIH